MKKEKIAKKEKVSEWVSALVIPEYLIRGIGDSGTYESYDIEGNLIDSDDLRISIEISGGHKVLVPVNGRICICENGDIEIEVLKYK